MKPVLSAAETAELDARATEPVEMLMERAGLAVALAAVRMGAGYGRRVVVLAGPGNNGGDGYVAARYLHRRGAAVEVLALAEPRSDGARWAYASAAASGVPISPWRDPFPADLVVDALFGAGFRGELPASVARWTLVEDPVLAVDVPSGLDATTGLAEGPVFWAARTVTFHSYKVGHFVGDGPDLSGEVEVADIGLRGGRPDFWLCEESDAPRPERARTAHKWSVGSVLVVGGSPGMTGAALLAARSALNAGAGSAAVACPGQLQPVYAAAAPELLTFGAGKGERFDAGDAMDVLEAAQRYDVLALGPGLGRGQEGFVKHLLEGWGGLLVIDADGINGTDEDSLHRRVGPTVITPHPGEFARLTGEAASYVSAAELARATGVVVLLKGNPTFVCGEEQWVVTTGGPELASIGTGDVLTGMLAALWSRGLSAEVAARSSAYWHGRAGAELAVTGALTADLLAREVRRWAR